MNAATENFTPTHDRELHPDPERRLTDHGPAAVNIDNTLTTLGFNIQMKNSGANANTYVTRDLIFEALT
jgi:hypothetical protein